MEDNVAVPSQLTRRMHARLPPPVPGGSFAPSERPCLRASRPPILGGAAAPPKCETLLLQPSIDMGGLRCRGPLSTLASHGPAWRPLAPKWLAFWISGVRVKERGAQSGTRVFTDLESSLSLPRRAPRALLPADRSFPLRNFFSPAPQLV